MQQWSRPAFVGKTSLSDLGSRALGPKQPGDARREPLIIILTVLSRCIGGSGAAVTRPPPFVPASADKFLAGCWQLRHSHATRFRFGGEQNSKLRLLRRTAERAG